MCSPEYFLIFEVVGQVIWTQPTASTMSFATLEGKRQRNYSTSTKLKSKMIGRGGS